MKVPQATIHNATVLKAIMEINSQGIELASAGQISEVLMRPKNFDMGGKLYGLCKKSPPLLVKNDSDHFNTYQITDEGKQYYKMHRLKAQKFGEYDAIGESAPVNTSPAAIAVQAAQEMQQIIDTHTRLRMQLQRYYHTAVALEKELDE